VKCEHCGKELKRRGKHCAPKCVWGKHCASQRADHALDHISTLSEAKEFCRKLEFDAEVMRAELRKAQDHLESAWCVIANAGTSLGDWNSMTPEWRGAAEEWRDEWLSVFKRRVSRNHTEPRLNTTKRR